MIFYDFGEEQELIGCNSEKCSDCCFEAICHSSDFEVAGTVVKSEGDFIRLFAEV